MRAAATNCCGQVGQWSEGWLYNHFCIRSPFGKDVLDGFECTMSYLLIYFFTSSKENVVVMEEVIFFTSS